MGWVSHLQDSGFTVRTTDVPDVTPIKTEHDVPGRLFSCHFREHHHARRDRSEEDDSSEDRKSCMLTRLLTT